MDRGDAHGLDARAGPRTAGSADGISRRDFRMAQQVPSPTGLVRLALALLTYPSRKASFVI